MKKSQLALLLPLLVGASAANAMELYNDNKNSLGLTGWLGFNALYDGDETAVNDNLSQLRFTFEREERNGWRAYAVTEWGVNIVSGNEDLVMQGGKLNAEKSGDFLNNRLGYVGLSHDHYGSLTFGKQWGAYYDVAGTTDLPNVFAGYSVGAYGFGDGGLTGTGRADSAFLYRNSFGPVSIALQYAAKNNGDISVTDSDGNQIDDAELSFDNSYGASVTWAVTDKFSLLAGMNRGDITGHIGNSQIDEANQIIGIGAMYGSYYHYADERKADGLYVGFNAHQSENNEQVNGDLYDATGAELMLAWQADNGFVPMAVLTYLDLDTDDSTPITGNWTRRFAMVGLHYRYSLDTVMFFEAKLDFSDMDDKSLEALEDNQFAVGINYFF
ncbi:porin [Shewanella litorisediminis]|uniref:Porin n=1 Tax=Shewanella litorisediminis TaxID=1173586 RepID=A0ABX7G2N6_9GAMM|nr:porin [Shewanella litorisediminis]MCL2917067.1 porin [Shewanella litorisediminis]QRH01549.1 porin [Shewanella litorisediminis]